MFSLDNYLEICTCFDSVLFKKTRQKSLKSTNALQQAVYKTSNKRNFDIDSDIRKYKVNMNHVHIAALF